MSAASPEVFIEGVADEARERASYVISVELFNIHHRSEPHTLIALIFRAVTLPSIVSDIAISYAVDLP